jgi:hypothetical protein
LRWNDEITEAAWIKIAEGVAASESLQNLEHGARSLRFASLFFCTASVQNKTLCLLFYIFSLLSSLQLGRLQPVWSHQRSN